MKNLITILVLCFSISALAQQVVWKDPSVIEKEERAKDRFPSGYNPDGKCWAPVLTFGYGREFIIKHWTSWGFWGTITMPVHQEVSFFLSGSYSSDWSNPFLSSQKNPQEISSFAVGIRLFGGM